MLTLTRKVGERILIGDDIVIVVHEVRGRQVRLGIAAPASTPVFREELAPHPTEETDESDEDTPEPTR